MHAVFVYSCKDSLNLNETAIHEDDALTSKPAAVTIKPAATRERRRVSESSTGGTVDDTSSPPTDNSASTLPQTLSYLVLFWDELSKCTSKKIAGNQLPTSSGTSAEANGKKAADRSKVGAKKAKDGKLGGAGSSRQHSVETCLVPLRVSYCSPRLPPKFLTRTRTTKCCANSAATSLRIR